MEHLSEFEAFLSRTNPNLPADAPRVALLAGFADPQDRLNRAPVDALITQLEQGGARVYPVFGRQEAFRLLQDVKPDLVLTFPHGRLGTGDSGIELLKQLNCPIVSALPLLGNRDTWLADERGMEGGFLGQSITSPELGRDHRTGRRVLNGAERTKTQCPHADRHTTPIAGSTRFELAQASQEVQFRQETCDRLLQVTWYGSSVSRRTGGRPALWNTLKRLEADGYDLGNSVPESPDALFQLIQTKGRTIGQWALGSYEEFLKEAEPELIPAETYAAWFRQTLSPKRQKETLELWGDVPGDSMVTSVNGSPHLVISRIQLGKIVIMPQPTVGSGDDDEDEISSIHGTDQAAPHFYLGAYLWARYGFQADAIVHFGTHGSLEFTYGKSNCLSQDCWPQILIGDVRTSILT